MYGYESCHLQNKVQSRISVVLDQHSTDAGENLSTLYSIFDESSIGCSLLIILLYFLGDVWYHKVLLQLNVCRPIILWFVGDSRQPANNKAGWYMGHILQHSRVGLMSHVFYQFCSFLPLLSFCLFSGCICVYVLLPLWRNKT